MENGELACEFSSGLYRIELNRPEALNAWTPELGRALLAVLGAASADAEVRAIMVTGRGRAFSSGADLKHGRETTRAGAPDLSSRLREIYNPIIVALRTAPKPVIAAVNGPAAGLGFALALACDLIVAARSAYFLLPFVRLGLIPDAGALYLLAARVGAGRAARLAMLGERLAADEAYAWGLVDSVYDDDRFADDAHQFATTLAAGPTLAYASSKAIAWAAIGSQLSEQLELEATVQQRHATSHDYHEGVAAFKEKRQPRFLGR